jgi:tetratricopeptide (TPR) repeat protein
VGVLLAPTCAFGGNLAVNNRHQYFLARDYVSNIESTIAPHGMLLTSDWQVYSPLLYTREIEGQRRDIIAIDVNMLRRSWYFDYLKREYPELMQQTREKVEAFLDDLKAWEQDPGSFERSREMTQRIDSRFHEMIAGFIGMQLRTAPAYATNEVALETSGGDPALAAEISRAYKLAPQGLVFQLTSGPTPAVVAEPKLELRGLFDGTLKFDADDVVSLKVKPVYLNMMLNRGRYFVAQGDYQRAIKTFREVLELDPSFATAQQDLSKSLDAARAHQ